MPYKIRRISDGLYSSGGTYISWTKKGKVWSSKAAVSNHIAYHGEYDDAAEVVEMALVEVSVTPFEEFENNRVANSEKRKETERRRRMERDKKRAQEEIDRLKKFINDE